MTAAAADLEVFFVVALFFVCVKNQKQKKTKSGHYRKVILDQNNSGRIFFLFFAISFVILH